MKRAALLILLGGALLGLAAWPSVSGQICRWLYRSFGVRMSPYECAGYLVNAIDTATVADWSRLPFRGGWSCGNARPFPDDYHERKVGALGVSVIALRAFNDGYFGERLYLHKYDSMLIWTNRRHVDWAIHTERNDWRLSFQTSPWAGVSYVVHTAWLWGAGLLATGAGAASIVRARRRRRAQRGCCWHCGYDLAGLDATAPCPECGQRRQS